MSEELKAELTQAAEAADTASVETVSTPEVEPEVASAALGEIAIGPYPGPAGDRRHYSDPPRYDVAKAETVANAMVAKDKELQGEPASSLDIIKATQQDAAEKIAILDEKIEASRNADPDGYADGGLVYDKFAQQDRKKKTEYVQIEPLSKLYDLNPEKFGTMPTAEFMEIAKELDAVSREIRQNEDNLEALKTKKQQIIDTAKAPVSAAAETTISNPVTPTETPQVSAVIEPAETPSL